MPLLLSREHKPNVPLPCHLLKKGEKLVGGQAKRKARKEKVGELWNLTLPQHKKGKKKKLSGSGGIRTHASEETGALNQRLRPLGHATIRYYDKAKLKYLKL